MKPFRTRVVLDTNVLISGILFEGSEAEILHSAEVGRIAVFVSLEILGEFVNVLSRPKFQLATQEILAATEYILSFAIVREPTSRVGMRIRDPEDLKFLGCAQAARAHFLVTGDKDLLTIGKFQNTRILTPSQFLSLKRDAPRA